MHFIDRSKPLNQAVQIGGVMANHGIIMIFCLYVCCIVTRPLYCTLLCRDPDMDVLPIIPNISIVLLLQLFQSLSLDMFALFFFYFYLSVVSVDV